MGCVHPKQHFNSCTNFESLILTLSGIQPPRHSILPPLTESSHPTVCRRMNCAGQATCSTQCKNELVIFPEGEKAAPEAPLSGLGAKAAR